MARKTYQKPVRVGFGAALERGIVFRRHVEIEVRRGRYKTAAQAVAALHARVWARAED